MFASFQPCEASVYIFFQAALYVTVVVAENTLRKTGLLHT